MFLIDFFFFEVVHILLIIVIMHYILLISFCTTKNFKFQTSHSLKETIMIIKIYHIFTIDIIQITDRRIQIERERERERERA